MLRALAIAACLGGCASAASPSASAPDAPGRFEVVRDRAGLEAALVAATDQPLLLDVTAMWCAPCVQLTRETFVDARVVERLADHRWVALDVSDGTDEQLTLQEFFGATSLPRVMLWSNASTVLASIRQREAAAPVGTLELTTFVTADELIAAIDAPPSKPTPDKPAPDPSANAPR